MTLTHRYLEEHVELGTDIIEIDRIEKILKRFPTIKERLFTETEIVFCERNKHPAQHYAARFAAKESVMKALGTDSGPVIRFRDIEITVEEHGKPGVRLHGRAGVVKEKLGIAEIKVSLSHCRRYATAVALGEEKRKN